MRRRCFDLNWPRAIGDEEDDPGFWNTGLGVQGKTVRQQLAGLVVGDTRELHLFPKIPALASGAARTVTKAYFTLKLKHTDSDPIANATFTAAGGRLSITTTNVVGDGQILNAYSPELRFDLTAANTGALTVRREYLFDVQVIMSDGAVYTVENGSVEIRAGVTAASS